MIYLTGIFEGFDKCTKATLQSNYFWGTPPDDCFCLGTSSRYYYNVKRRKFKAILIWKSSRKMNRSKNLLILYYLWKKLSKFSIAQKRFSMLFLFNFVPQQILIIFYVSLCEINCIKIQTINLVVNLTILA